MIKQLEPTSNQTVFPYTRSNANKKLESCWHGLKPKNSLIERTNFQFTKAGTKQTEDLYSAIGLVIIGEKILAIPPVTVNTFIKKYLAYILTDTLTLICS